MIDKLKIRAYSRKLAFKHPFGISRWTTYQTENIFVEVSDKNHRGLGEGAPNARYGESAATNLAAIEKIKELEQISSVQELRNCLQSLSQLIGDQKSALAAIDGALWDYLAKQKGVSVQDLLSIEKDKGPQVSYTIGISSEEELTTKLNEAQAYALIKLKLGQSVFDDKKQLDKLRSFCDKPLIIDANEGWKNKEDAKEMLRYLEKDGNIKLCEQPMPASHLKDIAWLQQHTTLPLYADEGSRADIAMAELAKAYAGINIKLDKQGGIYYSMQRLKNARNAGLSIMVGCMIASSLSLTQAAHIAMDADYADLDGHLLLKDDPYRGLWIDNEGYLRLPSKDEPGLGVKTIGEFTS